MAIALTALLAAGRLASDAGALAAWHDDVGAANQNGLPHGLSGADDRVFGREDADRPLGTMRGTNLEGAGRQDLGRVGAGALGATPNPTGSTPTGSGLGTMQGDGLGATPGGRR